MALKIEKIETLNVEITCRSCLLESDKLTSLFTKAASKNNEIPSSMSLAEIFSNILCKKSLAVTADLPTQICDLCLDDLLAAYTFKIKSEKCENLLNNFIKSKNVTYENESTDFQSDFGIAMLDIKSETIFDNEATSNSNPVVNNDDPAELSDNEIKNDLKNIDNDDDDDYDPDYETTVVNIKKNKSFGKFKCEHCQSKFSTKLQLVNHEKIHSKGDSKFYCSSCDKCFANNRNLQRHKKLHLKEQFVKTSEKGMNDVNDDPMETDVQYDIEQNDDNNKNDVDENKKDIKLNIKVFNPELKLKLSIERNFPCKFCSSRFSNENQLSCHMKAHSEKKFFCEACDRYFVNNRNLQRHLKLHYGPSEFKCTQCDKKFESKLRWKLHERSHLVENTEGEGCDFDKHSCMPHESKTLECKICGSTFTKIYQLREHLLNHIQPGTIDIEYMQKSNYLSNLIPNGGQDLYKLLDYIIEELQAGRYQKFYSATNMVANELNLSDSETDTEMEDKKNILPINLYYCDLCEKTFTRRYQILYHQRNDHAADEMKIECENCGMKYVSKQLLDYHTKTQCGNTEKHFTCDVCKSKYMWKENIEQHIRIHHTKTKQAVKLIRKYTSDKKLECSICQKKFSRPEHLNRHERTHNPDEKKFECVKCQKKFSRKDNLKSHMKVHEENHNDPSEESKSFLCVFCGRKFRNSSNLVVHTRRHTGEKPFKCDFCDKGFPRSSDLRTHRRTHTGEKPHLCTLCGKGFSRSNKLTRHMRIHSGVRPYKCTYCDRAFTQSNDLTIHVRRHTGEKPYVCGICGERFIQGTALHNHRKSRNHYEEGNVNVPFLHISQNNPTPLNNSGRVDRIGMPKNNATGGANANIVEIDQHIATTASSSLSTNTADYKDITSFINVQHSIQATDVYEMSPTSSSFNHDSN